MDYSAYQAMLWKSLALSSLREVGAKIYQHMRERGKGRGFFGTQTAEITYACPQEMTRPYPGHYESC